MHRVVAASLLACLACRVDGGTETHRQRPAVDPTPRSPGAARPEVVQLGSDRFRPGGWARRAAVASDGTMVTATATAVQAWSLAQGIALGEPRSTHGELEVLAVIDGGATVVGVDLAAQLRSWPLAPTGLGEASEVQLDMRGGWRAQALADVGHGNLALVWAQPFVGEHGVYQIVIHRRSDGARDGRAKLSAHPYGIWAIDDGFVVVHGELIEVFDVARAGRRGALQTADGRVGMPSGAGVLADRTTFVLVAGDRMSRWDVRTRKLLDTRRIGRPLVGCHGAAVAPAGDRILCEPPVDPPWIAALPDDPRVGIDPRDHVPVERGVPLFDADELAWTTDGTKLVDTRPWWTPSVWATASGTDLAAADGPLAPVRDIAWLADDRLLAIDGVGDVRGWDPWTARPRSRAAPMRIDVKDAAFSPAGDEVAICRGSGLEIRALTGAVRTRSDGACRRVAWIGTEAVWVSGADELRRLDVRGEVPIQRGRPLPGPHADVLATADAGRRVATAAGVWNDEDLQLWTPPGESPIGAPPPRLSGARAIALVGDRLLVAADDGTRLFPLGGGPPVAIAGRDPEITAVAIEPHGLRIAMGDANGRVAIVLPDGTPTTLARTSHRGPVRRLWWHEQTIVSAGDDTTIVLWSPP